MNNEDYILLHSVSQNTTKKITAELFRAYLNAGFAISVDENGFLVIGGTTTGTRLVGMVLRVGDTGLEVSSNGGGNYTELISFTEILDGAIEVLSESDYEDLVVNEEIDENKIYYTYEE